MRYRPEIDGLRALAVIAVILFHARMEFATGGYVGVDVFFVVSGYLITSIIQADIKAGTFSLFTFYENRARRILPALFLVVTLSIPFAWFSLPPNHMQEYGQSVAAVSVFASNVLFLLKTGYFKLANDLQPLYHTWSLAVEEQFYILYPLIFLITARWGGRLTFGVLVVASLASFAAAVWGATAASIAAFYLLPTRMWELGLGAILAFRTSGQERPRGNQIWSLAGLAMVCLAILLFDRETPFPGYHALLPTIGTVLIIQYAGPRTVVYRLLSQPVLVGLGLVSYSAYLWHQPLLAFTRHWTLSEPSLLVRLALIVMTFCLAYPSWRFVELPFRRKAPRRLGNRWFIVIGAMGFSICLAVLGVTLDNTSSFTQQFGEENARYLKYLQYKKEENPKNINCRKITHNIDNRWALEECLNINNDKDNILIIGDSYAKALWPAISRNRPDANVSQTTALGCKPIFRKQVGKPCGEFFDYVFAKILADGEIDEVYLIGLWKNRDVDEIVEAARLLGTLVPTVYVFGPSIDYRKPLPLLLARISPDNDWKALSAFERPGRARLSKELERALASESAHFVSLVSVICPDGSCKRISSAGEPMLYDNGHFTASGADDIVKALIAGGDLTRH